MRLVIDWDGTVTAADTMDLIVREFGDAELVDRFSDAFIDDSKPLPVTLQHVIESEMATITTPLAVSIALPPPSPTTMSQCSSE